MQLSVKANQGIVVRQGPLEILSIALLGCSDEAFLGGNQGLLRRRQELGRSGGGLPEREHTERAAQQDSEDAIQFHRSSCSR